MKRITASLLILCILFISSAQLRADALASVFEHSDSYRASEYYDKLLAVNLTGNFAEDIAAVAMSQVGYHEGRAAGDLGGGSTGKANYTEYGANFGLPDDAWCSVFVWWCARQAGINESIIQKTEWAKTALYSFDCRPHTPEGSVSIGDIAFIDMNYGDGIEDHVGIVVGVTDSEIITVEGNSSNGVRKQVYSRLSGLRDDGAGDLLYLGTPDYKGENTDSVTYETIFVSSIGASTYSNINGEKTGSLGGGEYMLLAVDPTGNWLQLVAANGIDSCYIAASSSAEFTTKNLPPITGYDAWSGFTSSTKPSAPSEDISAPVQTDPSVTTTTVPTSPTTSSAAPTQTEPSSSEVAKEDTGYTSSFDSEWIKYAAYVLLGILAVAFIVILASLMGRKDEPKRGGYDDYM